MKLYFRLGNFRQSDTEQLAKDWKRLLKKVSQIIYLQINEHARKMELQQDT